jgi:hypothetical protein
MAQNATEIRFFEYQRKICAVAKVLLPHGLTECMFTVINETIHVWLAGEVPFPVAVSTLEDIFQATKDCRASPFCLPIGD